MESEQKKEKGMWGGFTKWVARRSRGQLLIAGVLIGGLWLLTMFVIDPLPFLDEAVLLGMLYAIGREFMGRFFDEKEGGAAEQEKAEE